MIVAWFALAAAMVLASAPGASTALAASDGDRRALLAFYPLAKPPADDPDAPAPPGILELLDKRPGLSLGLSGATQGRYSMQQALLDITQGTRVSAATYDAPDPPDLALYPTGRGGLIQGWLAAKARAESAPADIVLGLLAESVPRGAGYAGVASRENLEAVAAANFAGRIDSLSLGPSANLAERATRMLDRHGLVVVGMPTGERGGEVLDALIAATSPRDLLIVMEAPPDRRAPQLLPTGIEGPGPPAALTSPTTRLDGVFAGIDVLPTVLQWLGVDIPSEVKGQAIERDGPRDAEALQDLADRLRVVGPRRFPALETVLALWLGVLLVLAVFADRRGVRAAMRLGALAFLWVLPVLLVTAAVRPSRVVELGTVAIGTFVLAAITDALMKWPRAPLVPAATAVILYIVDLVRGSELIIQSLLGPNPRFGSRYYGIGNELESALPVLLFLAIGILYAGRGRTRAGAAAFGVGGLILGVAVGAGRLGADVGGVITIGAGTAVAVLFMLPGGVTRRALALAVATPAAALAALAAIDLASGGDSHFTRTVLRAEGEGAVLDIVARRYELAFNVLKRGLMPFATAIAVLTVVYGLRYRERIYAPIGHDPAWTAAFAGSLASAIAGTLFNDSGPLLLIFGVFVLTVATIYVRGDPRLAQGNPSGSEG